MRERQLVERVLVVGHEEVNAHVREVPRVFVKDVQLWAVVVDPTVRRRGQSSWDRDAGSRSVLEPGENKLMLEFVGMEREIAMLRRHT